MSDVKVTHYWLNRLLCWHGRKHRRLDWSSNAVVAYCGRCYRKRIGLGDYDFYEQARRARA